MKMRWLIVVACVTACASTETLLEESPDGRGIPEVPPAPDSGLDGAPTEADAGPCADCEYYPDVCSADTLCPNGPFDSSTPGGGVDPRLPINVIRGRSVTDVWAAGALGTIAHFDGTSWTRSDLGSRESLYALWLRDPGEVALASLVRAYTRSLNADAGEVPTTGGWKFNAPLAPTELTSSAYGVGFVSAWGAPGGEWLWTASTWRTETTGLWRMRRSLHSASLLEVEAGVTTATCSVRQCREVKSIHGASADELWAVGESGSAVLITDAEGAAPSMKVFNAQTWNALNGVWVASPSDAWAVGAKGTVRHYTGAPVFWDVISDIPTREDLKAVWGSSSTDVWAVGDAALVLHYDGKSWSRVKIAGLGSRRPDLTTVWVAAPGHVWVGGQGVILSLGGKP